METVLDQLVTARTSERRERALARARLALAELGRRGVRAGIIGSLAAGRFRAHSDVDFLVLECPAALRYAIEGALERIMDDIGFDVLYLDELDAGVRARAIAQLKHAADL